MFASKVVAYPIVEHLKGAPVGYTPALHVNVRLECREFPVTNTLAYFEQS
jgi:hypothetical protein